jgi:hypothetical protein
MGLQASANLLGSINGRFPYEAENKGPDAGKRTDQGDHKGGSVLADEGS